MAENNNTLLEKLDGLVARFEEVSTLITDPNVIADQKRYVKLTKEYKDLNDIMKARREYIQCLNGLEEAKQIMTNESDPEMKEMAREEANLCEVRIPELEEEIKLLLVPADPQDDRNAILEIRGGTGGDEPPFLQATCSVCTPNTARQKVGDWKYPAPMKEQQEVLRKLSAP
jgi:peptide chain release factor 1